MCRERAALTDRAPCQTPMNGSLISQRTLVWEGGRLDIKPFAVPATITIYTSAVRPRDALALH